LNLCLADITKRWGNNDGYKKAGYDGLVVLQAIDSPLQVLVPICLTHEDTALIIELGVQRYVEHHSLFGRLHRAGKGSGNRADHCLASCVYVAVMLEKQEEQKKEQEKKEKKKH
jgi:hypothetical protein